MNPHDEHDAWLAQALRHAPDANADAPTALSEAILLAARAAARPSVPAARHQPNPAGLWPRLASAWSWLARPPVAAGFASVMLATLVGVMWWGQPLDDTLRRAPEVVSSTPPTRAEPAPPVVVAAVPAAAATQTAAAEPAAPQPGRSGRATAAEGRLAEATNAAKSARTSRPDDTRARARADGVAIADEPATAAAAADLGAAPQAPRLERMAPVAKAQVEAPTLADSADQAATPRPDRLALKGSAGPSLAKVRGAESGELLLSTLRAQITQQPQRWQWQRGNGAPQPMNSAVQRWLAELDRQTSSRWQGSASSVAREAASSLRLLRDGALQATLGWAGSAVWAEAAGASAEGAAVASVPQSTAESLRKALDEATP
jgi:hypothetical protein